MEKPNAVFVMLAAIILTLINGGVVWAVVTIVNNRYGLLAPIGYWTATALWGGFHWLYAGLRRETT